MVADSAALVMFAIRSAIKLSQQLRLAYVDSTKGRDLILPLPNFEAVADTASAVNFFDVQRRDYMDKVPRVKELIQKIKAQDLTDAENGELLILHTEYFNLSLAERNPDPKNAGAVLSVKQFNAMLTIRQWQRGTDPNPPVIQRVAGALIEIGIDYAVNVPGAFNQNSKHGKVVAGFLSGLAEINFSEAHLRDLPSRLFIATLDTLSEQGSLLSADPKVQELIKVTTKGLSTDVARRIAANEGNLVKQERVADWGELVFRSVLTSAGGLVISDPKRFLGVEGEGESAAITKVGNAVLGLVLDQPDKRLDRVFGSEGLNTVVKAALAAVGEHPEILHVNQAGLEKLLGEVATQLAQHDTVLTPDVLPEVARLVLDKTGENLALLWPDLANDPAKNLALTAARTALDILTKEPAAGAKWTPRFSRDDLVAVADASLSELVANPGWLITKAGALDKNLGVVLTASLDVLRARGDTRLSPAVGVEVLRAALTAVSQRPEFVDLIPGGPPLVAAALDAILGSIFRDGASPKVQWRLIQAAAIGGIVHVGLEQLARADLRPEMITRLQTVLDAQLKRIDDGKAWDLALFEADLSTALQAA